MLHFPSVSLISIIQIDHCKIHSADAVVPVFAVTVVIGVVVGRSVWLCAQPLMDDALFH